MSDSKALSVEQRSDGIAVLWIDVPGESVNTLRANFSTEFHQLFDQLEKDNTVKGIVFASRKKDSFIAGADIEMLNAVSNAQEAQKLSEDAQSAMNRIADFGVPIIAAIHGSCLGGGLELALACHGRIASDHPKTKLGLPEVQLGLLPGAGGTQRLPRLIGLEAALDMMLTGKQIPAQKAQKLGMVDDVVSAAICIETAAKLALKLANSPSHLKRDFWAHRPASLRFKEQLLARNPIGRKLVFSQASKQVAKKTRGNYPAPTKIIEVIDIGLSKGISKGLKEEARHFGELAVSPVAQSLMHIFFSQTALKKDRGTDEVVQAIKVNKVGMLGAGLMGSGIAYITCALAKKQVRLKDRDSSGIGKGLANIRDILDTRVRRRRLSPRERDQTMALVTGTTEYTGFKDVDVAIEAVFEDINIKHQVLKEVESVGKTNLIFASNTSSLPITDIAEASKHPETVIGMHYFSPVHKMPLLEIIVTPKTAAWVTATCVELGKKQGKTVIVVNDGVGFYTSRILSPYMNEAAFLLFEGVRIEDIDRALVDFGFPVGPITLFDEVGIDVAEKVGKIVHHGFGQRLAPPPGSSQLRADGRLGRKNKKGFYLYTADKKKGSKQVDPSVYGVLGIQSHTSLSKNEIAERCNLQMVNEAALCFEQGILRSARDGDIGAIFGLGFPPFLGGPFHYVDTVGVKHIVERLEFYEKKHGIRFRPADILKSMASREQKFYGSNAIQCPKPTTQRSAA
ncbi:MAG: fatty acid oxidation complex subunit alpha FadJ [Myxococcales bacterium]|nr:MAG: fatty acid oxidation complex subunit alpha FadJ [Myxococcales bacterium]